MWFSEVEPGSTHDITAAREHILGALYWAYSHLHLPTLADGGYGGAGIGVHTPFNNPPATKCWTWTTAPTTPCSEDYAASVNAPSHYLF